MERGETRQRSTWWLSLFISIGIILLILATRRYGLPAPLHSKDVGNKLDIFDECFEQIERITPYEPRWKSIQIHEVGILTENPIEKRQQSCLVAGTNGYACDTTVVPMTFEAFREEVKKRVSFYYPKSADEKDYSSGKYHAIVVRMDKTRPYPQRTGIQTDTYIVQMFKNLAPCGVWDNIRPKLTLAPR